MKRKVPNPGQATNSKFQAPRSREAPMNPEETFNIQHSTPNIEGMSALAVLLLELFWSLEPGIGASNKGNC
jgi:hypothetical protein